MWEYEHSIEADVTPQSVWQLYTDSTTWPEWDYGIELVELDGPFADGSTGRITPRGRDTIPFTVVDVTENVSFTDETAFDGIVLRFIHRLAEVDGGRTRITHRVEISGPASDAVGPQIGPSITGDIPVTVANLAEIAAR
jgi:uncharacterized protein YndB with AHSA1/START domain